MNQPASNVTLKHPTGPWWTIYGTAGDIVQQIGQVFPHLTQNVGPTDFPAIVAQASTEWAQLVGATGQTPNQGNPGNQNFGGNSGGNQGGNGFGGGQGNGGFNGNNNQGGSAAPGGGKTCVHGAMEWKDFTSKAGNHVKGWFCQAPNRNDQCKPEYVR